MRWILTAEMAGWSMGSGAVVVVGLLACCGGGLVLFWFGLALSLAVWAARWYTDFDGGCDDK